MKKRAIITGSTGLTGSALLQQLLDSDQYSDVIALTRQESHQPHPKLTKKVIDFDDLATIEPIMNGDLFFCCLGTTIKKAGSQEAMEKIDLHYPTALATLAANNGIPTCVVISAIGASVDAKNFYSRTKGEMEQALTELPFRSLNIVRPSLLTGDRDEFRFAESLGAIIMRMINPLMIGRLKRFRSIPAVDVAIAMKKIADLAPDGVNYYESEELSDIVRKDS